MIAVIIWNYQWRSRGFNCWNVRIVGKYVQAKEMHLNLLATFVPLGYLQFKTNVVLPGVSNGMS